VLSVLRPALRFFREPCGTRVLIPHHFTSISTGKWPAFSAMVVGPRGIALEAAGGNTSPADGPRRSTTEVLPRRRTYEEKSPEGCAPHTVQRFLRLGCQYFSPPCSADTPLSPP